jgi:hypothetical protein
MRRRRRGVLAVVAILGNASCSLLLGVSADDYVKSDAGPATPGSPNTNPNTNPSWACGRPICDDFERDTVAHGDWTVDLDSGTLDLDPDRSDETPHRSLRARVGSGGGQGARSALLSGPFQNAHRVRCSFSLLINDPGPKENDIDLFLIKATGVGRPGTSSMRFGTFGTIFGIRLDAEQPDGSCHCPTAEPFYFGSITPPDPSKSLWRKVSIDTTMDQATVTIDDYNQTFSFESFPLQEAQIEIGIYDYGSGTADFSFDDLACQVE